MNLDLKVFKNDIRTEIGNEQTKPNEVNNHKPNSNANVNQSSNSNSTLNSQIQKNVEIDLDEIVEQLEERKDSIYEDCNSTYQTPVEDLPSTPSCEMSLNSDDSTVNLKRVDFVLVYQKALHEDHNPLNHETIRKKFEQNLQTQGLVLKHIPSSVGNQIYYVHVYAPYEVLARYAEVMALRMPMKTIKTSLRYLFGEEFESNQVFTTVFSKEKEYLFNIPGNDKERFFTPSQRGEIIDYILKRTRFKDGNDFFSIGIHKLLSDRVYQAAYPLHDTTKQCKECELGICNALRCYLLKNWASIFCILKYQQVDRIVDYFGVKIAMYYVWVGFYTLMLIPATGIGLLTFLFGLISMSSDIPTNDICHNNFTSPMCPICPKNCDFINISEACMPQKASYVMGNYTTVIFAIFISIWATIYLEMWKRYSARICFQWDLSDFSTIDEYPRPEYLAYLSKQKSTKTRINPVTKMEEPYISFVKVRLPYFIMSFSFVLLSVAVVLLIMVSIIVYRVSTYIALSTQQRYESEFLRKNIEWIVTSTAATINLILIMILSIFYKKLATKMTELEMPRTQNEFDNSLTLKMYLFEFVNYYSSLFYIAFFKGMFAKEPPEGSLQSDKLNKLIEPCPIGGCYFDLTIQLVIILLGKNLFSSMLEYLIPYLYGVYNRYVYFSSETKEHAKKNPEHHLAQYEEDYLLESWDHSVLFYEYLELVLQFGFITLFVSAFPLAPLFALLNNIFEIRFDARKMLKNYKRPVAQRVKDIGVWYTILDALGKLSVFTNAVIIAFNTDIIPRIMYYYQNGSLKYFYLSTIANYNITINDEVPDDNITNCFYYGNRDMNGSYTQQHWYVLIAKIIFVLVFQNVVTAINSFLKVVIPDEPGSLRLKKRQHAFITNELIIRHELQSRRLNKFNH